MELLVADSSQDIRRFWREYQLVKMPVVNWGSGECSRFKKEDTLTFVLFYYADKIFDFELFVRKVCQISLTDWFKEHYDKMTTSELWVLSTLIFKSYSKVKNKDVIFSPSASNLIISNQ